MKQKHLKHIASLLVTVGILTCIRVYAADGNIDFSFNVGGGFDMGVNTTTIQNDGYVIAGGRFTTYQGNSSNKLVRIDTNGNFDGTFDVHAGFNDAVLSADLRNNGDIIAGGLFTNFSGVNYNHIVGLKPDGSINPVFVVGSGFDNTVNTTVITSYGNVLVGGNFTTYKGVSSNKLIELRNNGAIEPSLNVGSGFDGPVNAIVIDGNGNLIIGGGFKKYNGTLVNSIVRLKPNGTIDNTFGAGIGGSVNAIAIDANDNIIIGGSFYGYSGTMVNNIVRIYDNGTIDTSFNIGVGFDGAVNTLAIQSNGSIVAGGLFTHYDGNSASRIARLDANGNLDNTFNIGNGFDAGVMSISLQNDNKIIVGGGFGNYKSQSYNSIIRLMGPTIMNSSFFINNDDPITTGANVTLTMSTIPPAIYMRFSNNGSTRSSWTYYSTSYYPWTLFGSYGNKTVYVQFDTDGDQSSDLQVSDSIAYFTGTFNINNNDTTTTGANVTFHMSTNPTASKMRFSQNAGSTRSAWENYSNTKGWTFTGGYGTYTIYTQFDANGDGSSDLQVVDDIDYITGTNTPPNTSNPVTACSGITQIPVSECIALLTFYNSTSGTNWTYNGNRGNTGNVCNSPTSWYGISCTLSGSPRHISEINLPNNHLSGYISSLSGLVNLIDINLNNNFLTGMTNDVFSGLTNLIDIRLSANKLTSIPNGALLGLSNLENLYLGNNQLSSIPNNVFDSLHNLQKLILGYNQISSIPNNVFDNLINLTDINLENNQISSIPNNVFDNSPNLDMLVLNNNQISILPNNIFDNLINLTTLFLSNNLISSIPSNIFNNQSNLSELILSNNLLTGFSNDSFNGLTNLQTLWLDNNQIVSLPINFSVGSPNLIEMHLNDNQLITLPNNIMSLSNLTNINVNNNNICSGSMLPGLIGFVNSFQPSWQSTQNTSACLGGGGWFGMATPFTINNYATTTTSQSVTLNMNTYPTASQMRFSNDGYNNRSARVPYSTTASQTLSAGYGTKYVWGEFDDGQGNTVIVVDDINYISGGGTGNQFGSGTWSCSSPGAGYGCISLEIVGNGYGYCEYGNSLDLGITGYSSSIRDISSPFLTTSGNATWLCNDLQGAAPWTLSIASSDLLNMTTNNSVHTISGSKVFISNPVAVKTSGVCTANSGSSQGSWINIGTDTVILGKYSSTGEVCQIETSGVDLKVEIPAYQALGQYSGTLTITVPNL